MEPTQQQSEAINYTEGNLLIVACAGSGKTETIARRVSHLVSTGVAKDAIIAFTFTEHAANELKARIRYRLEEACKDDPSLGEMYVGTIHSFCLRLLKELEPRYRNYEIMDDVRQAALISSNFVRFEDSGKGIGLDRIRARTKTGTFWETIRQFTATLSIMHQKDLRPDDLADPVLASSIVEYERIAYSSPNFFFDFNRIIDELISHLRSDPSALNSVRSRFSHLIIDEYQDVDDRQEELVQLITNGGTSVHVTAVGDDDQALYGFRGASVKNILTFEHRYPDVKRVTMGANFRSTHAIVDIADTAIRKVANRLDKEMAARMRDASTGVIVERMADPGDIQLSVHADEAAEASWVADRIEALRGTEFVEKDGSVRCLDFADMVVLLRSVKSAGTAFAAEMRRRGIPVVVTGTRGLFNNEEVRLMQAAFCLLARSDFGIPDEDGRFSVLTSVQTREYIREVIERLKVRQMVSASSTSFLAWISRKLDELDRRNLPREERQGRLAKRIYPQDIFQEMLRELGSQTSEWTSDVLYNLGAFSTILSQFEAVHQWITPSSLKGLCLFLGNWASSNADEGGVADIVKLNSVQIMTVHAAKGLEWPVVFLPRVSSSNFPSSRRNQGPDTFIASSIFDRSEYAAGDDGERRLWYVAITRCAKFLNVSSLDKPRKKPTEYFKDIKHVMVRRDGSDPTSRARGVPAPPSGAEMLPTTFSDLTYWWRCPFEYELRSLMGFSPGVSEQYGYGQQLHNILAELHLLARRGRILDADDVRELVDSRFHLRYTQGGPFEALREAAKRALVRYVSQHEASLLQTQAVEKPFEFIDHESGTLIAGVVDLLEKADAPVIGRHREAVGIVDFKAHKLTSLYEFENLRQSVERQLRLYASAVDYAFPFETTSAVAQLITPSAPNPELTKQGVSDRIEVDVSQAAQREALSEVRIAVAGIKGSLRSQRFERCGPKTGACPKCDFRDFCPGMTEWRRMNLSSPKPFSVEESRELELELVMDDANARP
jgi:DNA helicase II / ATP-dependent DNA helicase PcrA